MKKVALILSGCGHQDGSEIREAIIITLLALDRHDADVSIFAPDADQADVINHLTGEKMQEKRNVLVEAARIARGKIRPLSELNANNFDALIMPGGFGAAKNLADIASKGKEGKATEIVKQKIVDFVSKKKPVGAICIAPAIVASALNGVVKPTLTLGEPNDLLPSFGATEKVCTTTQIAVDEQNKIVSTPAYMITDRLKNIAQGIEHLVEKIVEMA